VTEPPSPPVENLPSGDGGIEAISPRIALLGLLAVLALTAAVRLTVLDMPLDRDEGEYAYGAQRLLAGKLPYVDFYSMKLPGMYLLYAFIFQIAGQSLRAIHGTLLLASLASISLIFFIGRRWFNPLAGLAAASTFAALSLTHKVEGTSAQTEPFIMLLVLSALGLAPSPITSVKPWRWLIIGLLCGAAILIKQQAAFFALGALATCAIAIFRSDSTTRRRAGWGLAALALGIVLPYAALVAFYWQQGAWDEFQRWTITYARQYGTLRPLGDGLTDLFRQLWGLTRQGLLIIWALAAIGLIAAMRDNSPNSRRAELGGLTLASFLALSTGLYFRPHYFVLLLPAVALAAAAGLVTTLDWLRSPSQRWWSRALIAIVLVWPLISQSLLIASLGPAQLTRLTFGRSPFPESIPIAEYLRAHTTPDQSIGLLGSEPQILFYAQRPSASGFLYMYPLMENQPAAPPMQRELIAQFEATQPPYVVFVGDPMSWLARETSSGEIFSWWDAYQRAHYQRVGLVEIPRTGATESFWDEAQAGREPKEKNWLAIYRRTSLDGPPADSHSLPVDPTQ
jgi:hypothetical protein